MGLKTYYFGVNWFEDKESIMARVFWELESSGEGAAKGLYQHSPMSFIASGDFGGGILKLKYLHNGNWLYLKNGKGEDLYLTSAGTFPGVIVGYFGEKFKPELSSTSSTPNLRCDLVEVIAK
jgi:hypothetical protein